VFGPFLEDKVHKCFTPQMENLAAMGRDDQNCWPANIAAAGTKAPRRLAQR